MAKKVYEEAGIAAIAERLREKTGSDKTYTTKEMSEGVSEVYDAGKKSEYDAFWDAFQDYGNRTDYNRGISGAGWNDETFKPKYDLIPVGNSAAYLMFSKAQITDLYALLKKQGVVLDTSKAYGSFGEMFSNGNVLTRVPELDLSRATNTMLMFTYCYQLQTIDNLIISKTVPFNNTFSACENLKNLTITGTIGQNGFDVHDSTKLSTESITSIVLALSDETSGLTVTLSAEAVENAFNTPIGLTPFEENDSGVFINNVDGTIKLEETPTQDTTYVFKTLVLPKGLYRFQCNTSHVDFEHSQLFCSISVNGEVIDSGGLIIANDTFSFSVDEKATVSFSLTVKGGLSWSEEPLTIMPTLSPDWDALIAKKQNWTISLA